MREMRGRIGVLFRGGTDGARVTAYVRGAAEAGFELKAILPERAGDPLLQAALCYRLLQLDYDAAVVHPEDPTNLAGRIRGALSHRPVFDVGPGTQPGLLSDVPGYHPVPVTPGTDLEEEVRTVVNALSAAGL